MGCLNQMKVAMEGVMSEWEVPGRRTEEVRGVVGSNRKIVGQGVVRRVLGEVVGMTRALARAGGEDTSWAAAP